MIFFESERLIFRQWKESDKEYFSRMNSDPQVMEFFPKQLNKLESDLRANQIIESIETNNYGLWAVEIKESNQFIGFIGLNFTDFNSEFTPCIEIGWRLGKEYWGYGYATEGAKEVLHYGFQVLKLDEVYSFTSKINVRSENVMKKIGMSKKGEFYHPNIEKDNKLCLHVLYKIDGLITK